MTTRIGFRVPDQLLLPWSPSHTISTTRAAAMLQVDRCTICRMIEAGEIKAFKKRPDKEKSPWHVNYDSVISLLEKIHKDSGLEKRF